MIFNLGTIDYEVQGDLCTYLIHRAGCDDKNIGFIDFTLCDGTHNIVRVEKEEA